jgi:3-hydroxyacyl-CoA dehydrogenase
VSIRVPFVIIKECSVAPYGIETVTVIGAGAMGAAIAGHLANAGLSVNLLDIAPSELTPEEEDAGLTLANRQVRNRVAQNGFERMRKARPANLFVEAAADRIQLGNLEDDFDRAVAGADWILEAIVEQPAPKQALMERIERGANSTAVISTNTSGIPIGVIAKGRSASFARRFLGTHFYNPPRYMHLLELIPTEETDPELVQRMVDFIENVLGKGVVLCKDTPNFVANRMMSFIHSDILDYAVANSYTVEEVDSLTGPLLGRPRTATFRLNDIVGVDVLSLVINNLRERIPDDEDRAILHSPHVTAILQTLCDSGLLGTKSGQGFYKTVVDGKGTKSFWGLDLQAAARDLIIEYMAPIEPRWSSVDAAHKLPLSQRLKALVGAGDEAGEFVWHTLSRTLAYASKRIPEITDSIVDLDNAMKWGFGWEMGPFEMWDALGVLDTIARMDSEGICVAPWVQEMLAAGLESFYKVETLARFAYCPGDKQYCPVEDGERTIRVSTLKRGGRTLTENESASLLDLGDDVLLVEFHSKMNTFDAGVFQILRAGVDRLQGNTAGLVIGNQGPTFSAGFNLSAVVKAAESGQFKEVEWIMREGQDVFMALRKAPKPVVAALFQRALGGGAEIALAADRVAAHAETYMGLVEVGVGLVPGWGGCKEMVRRNLSPHMHVANVNPAPYLRQIFETIGFAKVSTSAQEAVNLGYLSGHDRIIMNADHLLSEAKRTVLALAEGGYRAPDTTGTVYAAGRDALAAMRIEIYSLQKAGYISDYDATIAGKLAFVLCGGDLSQPAWMDEQYFLDLEREAILSLAGQKNTFDRIVHMLRHGKPLRN